MKGERIMLVKISVFFIIAGFLAGFLYLAKQLDKAFTNKTLNREFGMFGKVIAVLLAVITGLIFPIAIPFWGFGILAGVLFPDE